GGWYDGVSERDKKTFLALDQQSWQNINRVRVSGAGRVNYVVAKDDIGNWYVKQYSTDRTEVFKTMRNLAFLSAGNAFDGPLPMRGSDGSVMLRTNPVLRLQLSRAEANYAGAVTNAFHALAADATNLVTRIVESLSGFTNGVANAAAHYRAAVEVPTGALTNTVAVARNRLAEVAGKAGATPREVSAQAEAQALALVAALREFSARSAAKVAESTVENLTKEKTTVNQVTRERVLEVIRIRLGEVRDGLATFQDSLAVIRTGAE
ncbi:MAG: hypothetical protein JNL97_01695, partial [Verrucomicrobiales bacterium]|nr:hypothetical protein [Verrucomicrobiales bacterium]